MSSVTEVTKRVKQPKGGYLNLKDFECISLEDNLELAPIENLSSVTVGVVVDYLTRYMLSKDADEAFKSSIKGIRRADEFGVPNALEKGYNLLSKIEDLSDTSICAACKLVVFDVFAKNPNWVRHNNEIVLRAPDEATIHNIRVMIQRNLKFFEEYGPITKDGFTFGPNGYTDTVDYGEGDFLTKDTLWDCKVSKNSPTSRHTLQILMYYIMGKHSGKEYYNNITKIGMFNPRLNKIWVLDTNKISDDIIKTIEYEVICY